MYSIQKSAFALLSCFLSLLVFAAPVAAESQRRALLIGINEYSSKKVNNLRGAVNDVLLLKRVLTTRMAFPEENIRILTDAQATRAAILDALDKFVSETGAEDVVYIHYSGHGSRARDKNGDESDGFDETILPHDAREPGVPDIRDDELERIFARLPTPHALIVFDSCHSGTVTRSVSTVQPRSVPPDLRDELYESEITTRQVVQVNELGHVLMTGAPAEEEALDGPVDKGYYGLFSYSLARALDKNGPAGTAAQVHASVRQELSRIQQQLSFSPPEPQLEASTDRIEAPLLPVVRARESGKKSEDTSQQAGVETARRSWLPVKSLDKRRFVLVDGVTLNARPGSRWAIYAPGEKAFRQGDALALATVTRLSGRDALLQIDSQRAVLPAGARAIAVAPPDVAADMPVLLSGVPADRMEKLGQQLRKLVPGVKLVREGEFARYLVLREKGEWQLYDAGGLRKIQTIADAGDESVAVQLAQVLKRTANALSLLALDNPSSDISLRVGVRTGASPSAPRTRGLVKVTEPSQPIYRIRQPGAPRSLGNSLMIEVQSDQPVYLTAVSVDTEGSVTLLFPNSYQNPDFLPHGYIAANTLVRIPDQLEPGNRAGFYWDYAPPVGTDTLRVFASADLETATLIRKFIAGARKDKKALPELGNTLAGMNTRGIKVVADQEEDAVGGSTSVASLPGGDWTARSLTIDVQN